MDVSAPEYIMKRRKRLGQKLKYLTDSYFRSVKNGTLDRAHFFGLFVFIAVLYILFGLGMGAMIGFAEHLIGGDIQAAQAVLRDNLTLPALIVLLVLGLTFVFAIANISAKRARDIGLPGWSTIVILIALQALLTWLGYDKLSQATSTIFLLALLLVPTQMVRVGRGPSQ